MGAIVTGSVEPTELEEQLSSVRPAIVVVCGPPGVGKSTVSRRIADRLDAAVIRTDVVRKKLFADPDYSDAETDQTYEALFAQIDSIVKNGRSAVVDGTFRTRSIRQRARQQAEAHEVPFLLVSVTCDESVVEARIEQRDGVSDADFEIHKQIKSAFEPIEMPHISIDNSGGLDALSDQLDEHISL